MPSLLVTSSCDRPRDSLVTPLQAINQSYELGLQQGLLYEIRVRKPTTGLTCCALVTWRVALRACCAVCGTDAAYGDASLLCAAWC
eukprot:2852505-Rhodomonas_salina.1